MIVHTIRESGSVVRIRVGWRFFFQWRDMAAAAYKRYPHGKVTVGPFTLEVW